MRQQFLNLLHLKGFSKNTIDNYISIFDLSIKENENIFNETEENIISFLSKKIYEKNFSKSYVAQYVSVFNIVLKEVLKRSDSIKLPRPKKAEKQPDILSINEMQQILNSIENIKHKSIIALMYSTGMRVSEICNLKISDIDSQNNCIKVKKAKGDVDRVVMLDNSILNLLREYYNSYTPNVYLFIGAKGEKYSVRSIQKIIKQAANRCNINKNISTHSLRHSCFTHLIKQGVDIRSIQKLAGHKNITTTANYLRINDNDVLSIKSPILNISL
jgi:site-specific recombinase XerD